MAAFAHSTGMRQCVKTATRGPNCLDLVLSDLPLTAAVLPDIADHALVSAKLKLSIPEQSVVERRVWCFRDADWPALEDALEQQDWAPLSTMSPDEGAEWLQDVIKKQMDAHIGT